MKPLFLFFLFCLGWLGQVKAQIMDHVAIYDTAAAAWEHVAAGKADSEGMAQHLAAMSQAWDLNTELVRDSKAYYLARAAVVTAKVLAEDSQMEESALILKKAAEVIRDYGVDVTRGRGGSHLQEVAGVHVKVWNATGKDPFVGTAMAYELMREGDHFVVIQEGKKTDSSELLDGGLFLPNEKEGKLLHLNSAGTVLQACPVAITAGVGSLRSRLSAIFEQQPSEAGGPSRYARGTVEAFFAPQADSTVSPKTRSFPSALLLETNPSAISTGQKSSATSEDVPSATLWPIIAVMSAAALGLVWLLLKKRKV